MNWLWVILAFALIGGIVGYLRTGRMRDAAESAKSSGLGCAYVMLQIFLFFLVIYVLVKIGKWLFFS